MFVFFYFEQEIIQHLLFTFVQLPNKFAELISDSGVLMCGPVPPPLKPSVVFSTRVQRSAHNTFEIGFFQAALIHSSYENVRKVIHRF